MLLLETHTYLQYANVLITHSIQRDYIFGVGKGGQAAEFSQNAGGPGYVVVTLLGKLLSHTTKKSNY